MEDKELKVFFFICNWFDSIHGFLGAKVDNAREGS
jgi:hypothetical protein